MNKEGKSDRNSLSMESAQTILNVAMIVMGIFDLIMFMRLLLILLK